MSRRRVSLAAAGLAVGALALGGVPSAGATSDAHTSAKAPAKHVLLLSVDGLHQTDLAYYVARIRSRRWPGWWTAARSTPTHGPRSRPTRSPAWSRN